MALTVRDHMAITLAARRYKHGGAKDSDILEQLGMTPTRFWQYVNALLDRPDVLAAYPSEVKREAAVRAESARRLIGIDALASVLQWTSFIAEAADELSVDVPTLQARLVNLDADERRYLSRLLGESPHVGQNSSQED